MCSRQKHLHHFRPKKRKQNVSMDLGHALQSVNSQFIYSNNGRDALTVFFDIEKDPALRPPDYYFRFLYSQVWRAKDGWLHTSAKFDKPRQLLSNLGFNPEQVEDMMNDVEVKQDGKAFIAKLQAHIAHEPRL